MCSRSAESWRKRASTVKKCRKKGRYIWKVFVVVSNLNLLLLRQSCCHRCKRTEHCWPATPNIVGCYMLCPFAPTVTFCCVLLGVVVQSLKPVKHMQTDTTCWLNNVGTLFRLLAPSWRPIHKMEVNPVHSIIDLRSSWVQLGKIISTTDPRKLLTEYLCSLGIDDEFTRKLFCSTNNMMRHVVFPVKM